MPIFGRNQYNTVKHLSIKNKVKKKKEMLEIKSTVIEMKLISRLDTVEEKKSLNLRISK